MRNNNEFHTSEPRDEEIKRKRYNFLVAKGKPEKNQAFRDSNPDLGDTGGTLQPIELTSQLEAGH